MYCHLIDRKLFFLSFYYIIFADAAGLQENVPIKPNLSNKHLPPHQKINLRKFIAPMLNVQCSEKSISINYRFNRRYSRFMGDWYSLLEHVWLSLPKIDHVDDQEASSKLCMVKNERNAQFGDTTEIFFPTSKISTGEFCENCCGITTLVMGGSKNGTTVHKTTVKVSLNSSSLAPWIEEQRHHLFDVSCTIDQELSNEKFGRLEFEVANADSAGSTENFSEHDEILFHTELRDVDKFLPADLKTFPVDCWLDTVDQRYTLDRRYFLLDGCPHKDDNDHGLSSVSHFSSGYTRVGVKFSDFLTKDWFLAHVDRHDKDRDLMAPRKNFTQSFTINCRLLVCVHSNLHAVLRVPRCPRTTYCSASIDGKTVNIPDVLKSQKFNTVQSKPLNFTQVFDPQQRKTLSRYKTSKFAENPERTKNVECQCPPLSIDRENRRQMRKISYLVADEKTIHDRVASETRSKTVSISMLIFSAIGSLMSGAILTAVVWHFKIRLMFEGKASKLSQQLTSEMCSFRAHVSPENQSENEYKTGLCSGYSTSEKNSAVKILLYNEG